MMTAMKPWLRICRNAEGAPAGGETAATTTTAAATTTVPPVAAATTATGETAAAFVVPAEVLDWGVNKGYNRETMGKLLTENPDLYKMATSYKETEKMLHATTGADKIVMPKDINDFTQVAPVLQKLGAPAKGVDYKLEVPQGGDSTFALTAADKFAEVGVLPHQAKALNQWWNKYAGDLVAAQAEKSANEGRESATKLEQEWGADLKHNTKQATLGFNKLAADIGWDANRQAEIKNGNNVTLSAYEFAKLTKAYGDIAKVGGEEFHDADPTKPGQSGHHTPSTAKAEKERLLADPVYAKRYLAKDAVVLKEIRDLEAIEAKGMEP